MVGQGQSISVGANPGATFPNAHLAGAAAAAKVASKDGGAAWSKPEATNTSALTQLRQAIEAENWAQAFSESKTRIQAEASWSASEDRCAMLQCLATLHKASNILEIGSFCGVAALAMAEAIPKSGKVVALELEPYFVEFGAKYRQKSQAGSKIETGVGPAVESLKDLVAEVTDGERPSFDFVIIDGDKSSMLDYLKYVMSPYFLSQQAVVCMDVTPFKGQAPTRFTRFGAEAQWKTKSGESEIAALRQTVASLDGYVAHEFGGLLVMQRALEEPAPFPTSPKGADYDDEED